VGPAGGHSLLRWRIISPGFLCQASKVWHPIKLLNRLKEALQLVTEILAEVANLQRSGV
jgi:hypothetical protein